MGVTLEEFLQKKAKDHKERMLSAQVRDETIKDIPYIDNIPL